MPLIYSVVNKFFSGNVAAGSGTIIQWTYTLPTGKRAEIEHGFVRIEEGVGGAVGQAGAFIRDDNTTGPLALIDTENAAFDRFVAINLYPYTLIGSYSISGVTFNTTATIYFMTISCHIREYL